MRVLIIEDDPKVANYIRKGLQESGHTADIAADGRDGLFLASSEACYDVLVVDRMLPRVEGLTLINSLRTSGIQTPALVLSAQSKIEDRVKGLRSGADDYLTKPFAFEELLARLEVLSNRSRTPEKSGTHLYSHDLEVDLLARTVKRSGQLIDLKAREFSLLEYLLKHKGQVVTRTMLLENVWDYHFDPQTNVIDVHISRLRRKIDDDFEPALIETLRGAGYRLITD